MLPLGCAGDDDAAVKGWRLAQAVDLGREADIGRGPLGGNVGAFSSGLDGWKLVRSPPLMRPLSSSHRWLLANIHDGKAWLAPIEFPAVVSVRTKRLRGFDGNVEEVVHVGIVPSIVFLFLRQSLSH